MITIRNATMWRRCEVKSIAVNENMSIPALRQRSYAMSLNVCDSNCTCLLSKKEAQLMQLLLLRVFFHRISRDTRCNQRCDKYNPYQYQ